MIISHAYGGVCFVVIHITRDITQTACRAAFPHYAREQQHKYAHMHMGAQSLSSLALLPFRSSLVQLISFSPRGFAVDEHACRLFAYNVLQLAMDVKPDL